MALTQAIASQNYQFALVTGGAANADLTCTSSQSVGIGLTDHIFMAVEMAATTFTHTDRTSTTTCTTTAGKCNCSADTTGDVLFVGWLSETEAASTYAASCLRFSFLAADASASVTEVISDITTTDILLAVYTVDATSGEWTDVTSTSSIATDGYLTITGGTADGVVCIWYDTDPGANKTFTSAMPQFVLASGVAANTDITVTGIATTDSIMGFGEFHGTAYTVVADRYSTSSITDANDVQCTAATNANSDKVWIIWQDCS